MGQDQPRVACIVVAAGRGTRARQADGVAKQYQHIGAVPVLTRTLRAFASHPRVRDIVVVFHPDDRRAYESATQGLRGRLLEPVPGGATRQDSVRAGLEALAGLAPDIVLVHDAARPFLRHDLVDRVLDALATHAGAIPALPVADTLKRNAAGMLVGGTVARNGLYRAQTPQGFRFPEILAAHRAAATEGRCDFTDDAAVAEWRGMRVAIVEGAEINRKLTTAADIAQADREFRDGSWDGQERRAGIARGTLPLAAGDRLRMLGASVPWTRAEARVEGGDRAAATIARALLRAARLAEADVALAEAGRRVREAGGGIASVDLAVFAADLPLAGHRDAMRAWIADCLAIEPTRVGIEARPPAELGLEPGQGELSLLAQAIVTIPESTSLDTPGMGASAHGQARSARDGGTPAAGASLLDRVASPAALRALPEGDLPRLAAELRAAVMANAADAGRRPEASLGVVELTIALQRIFDTPGDRIVFETGDLAHANEVLAARRPGGTGADFGAAQAAAAISAGLGMAVARDLRGAGNRILCVIGGGALSSGVAYEAMSGAGLRNERLVVVLADDDAGGAAEVGSLSAYLARLSSSSAYFRLRDVARQLARRLPRKWERRAARAEELTRTYWTGGTLFEELGFHYVGPIDGHDFAHLLPVLRNVRDADAGPILVHVVVERGVAGREVEAAGRAPARASVAEFARSLLVEARGDPDVVAVLSAMPDGIGLDPFRREFPARCFDAGVAAQHAVAFAAGLATEGLKPFVLVGPAALRSACGQLVDDVLRRGLPVRFAVAGTGDGDEAAFAQPGGLAGMVAMVPADAAELRRMVATQVACGDGPSLLCLPRMVAGDAGDMSAREARLEVGRGRVLREGDRVALLSLGTTLGACLKAADMIAAGGMAATVADARFAMPLDVALVRRLARGHELLMVVEDARIGGFGAGVLAMLAREGLLDGGLPRVRSIALPADFRERDARAIAAAVLSATGRDLRALG